MKRALLLLAVAALLLSVSCSSIQVSQDYDRRAPFNSYKTFNWMPKPEKMPQSARSALERNPLLGKRIQEIVDEILAGKGLKLSTQNPDLLINYYVGFKEKVDITDWGYWYGPFWAYRWPFLGPYDTYSYTEGTLIMDFVDAKTKELVWRGVADKALYDYYFASTSNFSDSDLRDILTKMLAQFPPATYARRSAPRP
jgi:hypothetical protein